MSDNKTNKVKYNLKNVHVAVLTKTTEGYSYATPKHIPGAVSLSLDPEGDSNPFYADGIVYFRSTSNNGYSGDLEMALIPEWFFTDILKETLDSNGVLVERVTLQKPRSSPCCLSSMVISIAFGTSCTTALCLVRPLLLRPKRRALSQ